MKRVLYDFYGHRLGMGVKYRAVIQQVNCYNIDAIYMFNKEDKRADITKILTKRANELKKMNPQTRDERMIKEFLGCARVDRKHFIFVYYTGMSRERKEMTRVENWKILHREHLVHFHSHLNQMNSFDSLYQFNASDIPSTRDEDNIAFDVRYIINKWYNTYKDDEAIKTRLREENTSVVSQDYLINLSKGSVPMKTVVKSSPRPPRNTDIIELIQSMDVEKRVVDDDDDDPFEVKDDAMRRVNKEEYMRSLHQPIDDSIRFNFNRFIEVSRRAFISEKPRDAQHYNHDPIALFDALVIATNIEAMSHRIASTIPTNHLQVIENNNTTKIIDSMLTNENVRHSVHTYCEEYLYSLMTVEHAMRAVTNYK